MNAFFADDLSSLKAMASYSMIRYLDVSIHQISPARIGTPEAIIQFAQHDRSGQISRLGD